MIPSPAPIASLGMYDFPWLAAANDAIWRWLAQRLAADGFAAPARLERGLPLAEILCHPGLTLAQTCGYPLMTKLRDRVRLVAAPVYALPGCSGPSHRSFLVVRASATYECLADARGCRAAVNGWDSNSGMNLLRAAVAPLAERRPFFSAVMVTGSHLASLAAVRESRADLAAIDCVTHGLAALHGPDLLTGTRLLSRTPSVPTLPFVTRFSATDAEVATLRQALHAALATPALDTARTCLRLAGIAVPPLEAYEVVLRYERAAAALGYPVLA